MNLFSPVKSRIEANVNEADSTNTQSAHINRRILLSSRPKGVPKAENFSAVEQSIPSPEKGEVLLRTLYLSLDPYMRGRMNGGKSYAPPIALDDVMGGSTISKVLTSLHPDFREGDIVLSQSGWQDYAVVDAAGLTKLDVQMKHPSLCLGVLGMPGFTAYMGLLDIGQPQAGETVVVAAASGAVGSAVGQIAKLKGCRVVGIAGGSEKCRYVTEELGFDTCLDHHDPEFAKELASALPKGIDVYFESVGGAVFDAILPLLNVHARIPLCGLIAHYNDIELPKGTNHLGLLMSTLLAKRIKVQGFIIFEDYGSRFGEFYTQMSAWVKEGRIKFREDIVDGLENAPEALIGLLEGKNFGKLIVCVASE
ncbi:MAG: NADP-dependent oxidoreductase [Porticoccus sp.]|nr:NADP-dependent oxidoreductase [Porticoccus sp.]